ncbi:hypothetical protein BCV69DRAFT_280156 [Microstroma glucosiphilum]|uniref:Signal peptidase complex subunit 2 n=1 Tax=Pseudomicrostroma glucosiphilum TaxID=1684307 RepID=A0A316UG81_9BASI|nr:hypothetical protein BCV69DRAFT_280156 [Pseudomicrostroma glucosiphilum]PWN24266.1 hypothetical protein BCV69DRAFT_280156 [Pseudomicrostroma glucosiphilum]
MSLRPGKQSTLQAEDASQVAATASTSRAEDPLAELAGPLPAREDRIYVDNSSLQELKATCDEAVERILTRPSGHLAPAPSASSAVHSPLSSSADLSASVSSANGHADASDFPPFKASHLHTDLRLALGFSASFIVIGACLWAYFVEKDWQKNKGWTGVAVASYVVLSALQALDAYLQGDRIFTGKRKMLSKRIETEVLTIASPSLPKPTVEKTSEGQKWIVPPRYSLQVEYTRRSNGGKSLLRRVKQSVDMGHFGEWFTEEGEFVEAIFEQKLISGLERSWALGEE